MLELPPLSLYIHYPWCVKKCPYCDFNSHEKGDKDGYIEILLKDLDGDLKYIQNRKISSIFIGGGTPSLMSAKDLEKLFTGLAKKLVFVDDIEITLESNPASSEIKKFKDFRKIGINRLSIGVQSFDKKYLHFLGRSHNDNDAIKACNYALDAGFDNFNIDLMYGLKNQTIDECLKDIKQAISLKPTHISWYQLNIEPNTLFAKYPPKLPLDDDIFKMSENGIEFLEQNDFKHYEVSAFGKIPAKHNKNYWEFGDYIGIGAGAHGKITLLDKLNFIRTKKSKAPNNYLINPKKDIYDIDNIIFEFMLNALRLKNGFNLSLFEKRTNKCFKAIEGKLLKAQELDLIIRNDNIIKPSKKGFNFLNDLIQIFL